MVRGRDPEVIEEAGRHQRVVVLTRMDDELLDTDPLTGAHHGRELGEIRARADDVKKSQENPK